MLHKRRAFDVTAIDDTKALAEKLFQHTWCGCTGFRLTGPRPLLLLNDSSSPDAAQEYAVFDELTTQQIESLTISWMNEASITRQLEALRETAATMPRFSLEPMPSLHHPGPCLYCR